MRDLVEIMCPGRCMPTGCNYPKVPGSRVMVGNNLGPIYEIVHVADQMAWVRPLKNGTEGLAPLAGLRMADQS
jgi:hypothetical protein